MIYNILNTLNKNKEIIFYNYNITSAAFILSLIKENTNKKLLIISPDISITNKLKNDLKILSNNNVKSFYIEDYFPFNKFYKNKERISEYIDLIFSPFLDNSNDIFLLPVSILLKKFSGVDFIKNNCLILKKNEEIDREALIQELIEFGYEKNFMVSSKGDFAVRGDIIDIFSPNYDFPLRLTFWGDLIEDIKFFNPITQKSKKNIEINEIYILPQTEIILNSKNIEKIKKIFKNTKIYKQISTNNIPLDLMLCPSLIQKNTINFLDLIDRQDFFIILFNIEQLPQKLKKYEDNLMKHFTENQIDFISFSDYFYNFEDVVTDYFNKALILFSELKIEKDNAAFFDLNTKPINELREKISSSQEPFETLKKEIFKYKEKKLSIYLFFEDNLRKNNITEYLGNSINLKISKHTPVTDFLLNKTNNFIYDCGEISEGFISQFLKVVFISESNIFSKKRKIKTEKINFEFSLEKFSELKEGDYVVHIEHGIGIYKGIKNIQVGEVKKDFLVLEYLNNDKLYVPVEKLNLIQKYIGEDGHIPTIDRLGTERWKKLTEKVQKSIEKVARELLELYASRKIIKGISFKGYDDILEEFKINWEYDETPDQAKAIEEVLCDMEQEYPMERLICGDVGYGKTEVAIRATLKAVYNGYQVAFLVPTTILALQHYNTLKERFRDFPFIIEKISRFESKKYQNEILNKLKEGKIDILIGTHRLLQEDVRFKKLGLLIIDEEHKFGVKHKEKIKLLKKNIDVLSMTATPIPRTLQMSFLGVKDLSIISTPPYDRIAISSKIIKFDKNIIRNAIIDEINRNGQVYFVHNRVKSIYRMTKFLEELVPEAKFLVAHGQMKQQQLEKVYKDFLNKKADVLVCTTIIEAGLDNPDVNTIFINRADRYGLSQLYQLRGRVGRRDRQAFAYFIIPGEETITPLALKRLKILQSHSGLSQGFKIAMSDLEIRGAGNLFGEKQSGHILSVGYEFYMDLLEETIKKLKGEYYEKQIEPEINVYFSSFIPESYISSEKERLYIYKKISNLNNFKELEEYKEELIDRFGKIPEEVSNLFKVIFTKIFLKEYNIPKIDIKENFAIIYFNEKSKININKLLDIVVTNPKKYKIINQESIKLFFSKKDFYENLKEIKEFLDF